MFRRVSVFFLGAVLILGSDVLAIDLMGPPRATHKARQWSLGFDYWHSEEDVQLTDQSLADMDSIDDFEIDGYFGRLGLGFLDQLEAFVRIGAADVTAEDIDFESNGDFAWGWGTKATLFEGERIDWGALFQWTVYECDDSGVIHAYRLMGTQELNVDVVQVAFGPTVEMDGWRLYGGPFYYSFDADMTVTETGGGATKLLPDLEEEAEIGGYVGGQFDLGEMGRLTVEYANTGRGWAVGASLRWLF